MSYDVNEIIRANKVYGLGDKADGLIVPSLYNQIHRYDATTWELAVHLHVCQVGCNLHPCSRLGSFVLLHSFLAGSWYCFLMFLLYSTPVSCKGHSARQLLFDDSIALDDHFLEMPLHAITTLWWFYRTRQLFIRAIIGYDDHIVWMIRSHSTTDFQSFDCSRQRTFDVSVVLCPSSAIRLK